MDTQPIKDLLAKLDWQRDAEALYEAFIEALELIPDVDIRTEVCMNTVRHIATKKATVRVTADGGDEELASIFEDECATLAADMLAMPGQFRKWLKRNPYRKGTPRATARVATGIADLLSVLGGPVCDCERCTAFRASVGESAAETPTEVPPPPDPIN